LRHAEVGGCRTAIRAVVVRMLQAKGVTELMEQDQKPLASRIEILEADIAIVDIDVAFRRGVVGSRLGRADRIDRSCR
jgi:hypothetical protein